MISRSENMRRIRSGGMKPELAVRSCAHRCGYRFRLHAKDLPGKPDLVFRSRRSVIFVHGCFWHQHSRCIDGHVPKTNGAYWVEKLRRNAERDHCAERSLREMGWRVLVVWECQTRDPERLASMIRGFLG